jgi:hypothetical protein
VRGKKCQEPESHAHTSSTMLAEPPNGFEFTGRRRRSRAMRG